MAIKNYIVKNKRKNACIFLALIMCIVGVFVVKYVNNTNAGVFVKDENGNNVQINEINVLEIVAREGEQVLGYTVDGQEPISVSQINAYKGPMELDINDFKDATGYVVKQNKNEDGTFSYEVTDKTLKDTFNDNVLGQSMSVGEIKVNAIQASDVTVNDINNADLIYINSNDYNDNLLYYYDQFVNGGKNGIQPGQIGETFTGSYTKIDDKINIAFKKLSSATGNEDKVNELSAEDLEYLQLAYAAKAEGSNLSAYKEYNMEIYKSELAKLAFSYFPEKIDSAIPEINKFFSDCNTIAKNNAVEYIKSLAGKAISDEQKEQLILSFKQGEYDNYNVINNDEYCAQLATYRYGITTTGIKNMFDTVNVNESTNAINNLIDYKLRAGNSSGGQVNPDADEYGFTSEDYNSIALSMKKANLGEVNENFINLYTDKFFDLNFSFANINDSEALRTLIQTVNDEIVMQERTLIANSVGDEAAIENMQNNMEMYFSVGEVNGYNKNFNEFYIQGIRNLSDVNKFKTDGEPDINKIEAFVAEINSNSHIEGQLNIDGDISWDVASAIYSAVMSEDVALMYNTELLTKKTIGDYELELVSGENDIDNSNNVYKLLLLSRQIRDTYYTENLADKIDNDGVYFENGIGNEGEGKISWNKYTFGSDYDNYAKYHEPDVVGQTYAEDGTTGNIRDYVYKKIYSFTGEQFFGGKAFQNAAVDESFTGVVTGGTGYTEAISGRINNTDSQIDVVDGSDVIFLNTSSYGWSTPYVHFWNSKKDWGMIAMKRVDKNDNNTSTQFYVTVPDGATNVLFASNNNYSNKTANIALPSENIDGTQYMLSYYDNEDSLNYCSNLVYDNSFTGADSKYIYLDASIIGWNNAYAHFWASGENNLGGEFVSMEQYTYKGKILYRVKVPNKATNVLFREYNNWNEGVSTLNIKLPGTGPKNQGALYTLTDKIYPNRISYYSTADNDKVISAAFLTNSIYFSNAGNSYPTRDGGDNPNDRVLYSGAIKLTCRAYNVTDTKWSITSRDATVNKTPTAINNGESVNLGLREQVDSNRKTGILLSYKRLNANYTTNKYMYYRKIDDDFSGASARIDISNIIENETVVYCGKIDIKFDFSNVTNVKYTLNGRTRNVANGQTITIGDGIDDETKTNLAINYTMNGTERTVNTILYKRNVKDAISVANYLSIYTATNTSGILNDNTLTVSDNSAIVGATKGDIIRYILGISINEVSYPVNVLEIQPAASVNEFSSYEGALKLASYLGVDPKADGMDKNNYKSYFNIKYMSVKEFNTRNDDLAATYDLIYFGVKSGYQVVNDYTINAETIHRTKYEDSSMNGLVYTGIGDEYKVFPFFRGTAAKDYEATLTSINDADHTKAYNIWKNYFFSGFTGNDLDSWNLNPNPTYNWWGTKYPYYYKIKNQYTTTRLGGNDITVKKKTELLEYLKSGHPVLLADEIMDTDSYMDYDGVYANAAKWKYVDKNSKMYHFIAEAKNLGYSNDTHTYSDGTQFSDGKAYASLVSLKYAKNGKNPEYLSNEDKFKGGLSFAYKRISKVEFNFVSGPQEYDKTEDGGDIANGNLGTTIHTTDEDYKKYAIVLKVGGNDGVDESQLMNYKYDMFIDKSGVGKFESDAIIQLSCTYRYEKNTLGKVTSVVIEGNWPGALEGFVPWKIEAYNEKNVNNKFSYIGFSSFENAQTAIKDVYVLWIKPETGLNLNFYNVIKNNDDASEHIGDYNIHLVSMTYAKFCAQWDKNTEEAFINDPNKQYDSSTSLIKVNKLYEVSDTSLAYHMGSSDRAKIDDNKEFDMIVIGFADSHPEMDINNIAALKNIEYFVNAGHSLLYSHDNSSYYTTVNNYTDDKTSVAQGYGSTWGKTITSYMRQMLGMDQYGISYGGKEEDLPEEYKNARMYIDSNDAADFRGFSELNVFKHSTSNAADTDYKNATVYGNHLYSTSINGTTRDSTIADWCHTDQIAKTNTGQITEYPFVLKDNLNVSTTHSQYTTINLEDKDMTVWYVLDNDGTVKVNNNPQFYTYTRGDGANNYYIYSIGNITYTGAGHSAINDSGNNSYPEQKLFINTVVAALKAGNYAPEIQLNNGDKASDSTTDSPRKLITYRDGSDGAVVSFTAIDYDLLENKNAFTDCKIYLDVNNNKLYDSDIDILINDPERSTGYSTLMHNVNGAVATNFVGTELLNRVQNSFLLTNEDIADINQKIAQSSDETVNKKTIYDFDIVISVKDLGYLKATNPIPAEAHASLRLVHKEAAKTFNLN